MVQEVEVRLRYPRAQITEIPVESQLSYQQQDVEEGDVVREEEAIPLDREQQGEVPSGGQAGRQGAVQASPVVVCAAPVPEE